MLTGDVGRQVNVHRADAGAVAALVAPGGVRSDLQKGIARGNSDRFWPAPENTAEEQAEASLLCGRGHRLVIGREARGMNAAR